MHAEKALRALWRDATQASKKTTRRAKGYFVVRPSFDRGRVRAAYNYTILDNLLAVGGHIIAMRKARKWL